MRKRTMRAREIERLENTSLVTLVPFVADVNVDIDGACVASECVVGAPCTGTNCANCDVTCVTDVCVDSAGLPVITAPVTADVFTVKH